MIVVDQKGLTPRRRVPGRDPADDLERAQAARDHRRRLAGRPPPGQFRRERGGPGALPGMQRACSARVSQIPGLINKAQRRVSGHINIVMTSHVVSPHLDRVLYEFNADHPGVTYSLSVAESSEGAQPGQAEPGDARHLPDARSRSGAHRRAAVPRAFRALLRPAAPAVRQDPDQAQRTSGRKLGLVPDRGRERAAVPAGATA